MSGLYDLWLPKYEKRKNWRDRAVNKYIDLLTDNEVKDILRVSLSGTVPVSLYGKSQVGKTTFLLQLLDIKSECLETIHDILRCGSKHGEAATPTAMIYKKTPESSFKIHYSTYALKLENEDKIRKELVLLRKKVENQELEQLDEIVIEIPERYFNSQYNLNIQVCDLPGVESSNEKERLHVEKIIKKFIPLSALILVFQRGNDISEVSNLFNNSIMSEIYGWKYMPERFRLIMTFAYSAESVPRAISKGELVIDGNSMIDFYRKQAKRDSSNPDNVPDNVKLFPFEFGDSYPKDLLDKYNSDELNGIYSVMQEYWSEIREDILMTAETGNVVQRLSIIPHLLEKLIIDKENEKKRLIKEKQAIISDKENTKDTFSKNNKINEKLFQELSNSIQSYHKKPLLNKHGSYNGNLVKDELINKIDDITEEFRKNINNINELISLDGKSKWIDEVNALFENIKAMIGKIKFNKGFGPFGPDKKHKNILNNKISDLNARIDSEYNYIILTKKNTVIDNKNSEITRLKSRVISNNSEIEKIKVEINDCINERDAIDLEYSEKINNYQTELKKESHILQFMRNEILDEKENVFKEIHNKTSIESFLDILFIELIIKEFGKQKIFK